MDVEEALRLATGPLDRCGFFFDFDGTLAPIQLEPATVTPASGVVDALAQLTERAGLVAVVSARPATFLADRFASVPGLRLYGLYGLEELTVGGALTTHPEATARVPLIQSLIDAARVELPAEVGVEDKRLSVALHYRAAPHLQGQVDSWAIEQAERHGLSVQAGRMVVELRPPVRADKGTVLVSALDDVDCAWYFGDDVADLEAFAALDDVESRRPGFRAVRVAMKHEELDPRLATAADLMLDSPVALVDFLQGITEQPAESRHAGAKPAQAAPSPGKPVILSVTRASDADRSAVAERIRDAFADGRLDEQEFDARIHAALTARTVQDLEHLLDDLGPAAGHAPGTAPAARTGRRTHRWTVAVWSANERKGRWQVPESTRSVAVMGGTLLDLRTATLTAPVTRIVAVAVMGGADIIVPPGVRVDVSGFGFMGGLEDRVEDADLPATAPVVEVRWFALMGGVTVRTKQPRRH